MNWLSLTPMQANAGQIVLAAVLAITGFALLLPRPKGRAVREGIAALIVAAVVFGTWLYSTYGDPMPDAIGSILFWMFSAGALGFGTVLVVQKNPARGAIAFAFVILSTCGLFLLLAAPFLMAATIIIYAGAIIVTFLFVLMLSHAEGPSDENDRSREPLFGSFAGFAFTGLVLFTLYLAQPGTSAKASSDDPEIVAKALPRLPVPVLSPDEQKLLKEAITQLAAAESQLSGDSTPPAERSEVAQFFDGIKTPIAMVVGSNELSRGGYLRERLERLPKHPGEKVVTIRTDEQTASVLKQAAVVRSQNERAYDAVYNNLFEGRPSRDVAKAELRKLREEVLLLYGSGELPARNTANIGYLLYADHLLAVELAGTLLLVATIGAIAIAHRKRGAE